MKTEEILQLPLVTNSPSSQEEIEGALDLGKILRSLLRRWWIIASITLATSTLAALKALTDAPAYVGNFEVLVQRGSVETDLIANIPETLTRNVTAGQPTKLITVDEDLLKILRSPNVLKPALKKLKDTYPKFCQVAPGSDTSSETIEAACYQGIAKQLTVEALPDTLDEDSSIISVKFQGDDADSTAFVLKAISQAYLDYSLASKQADIRRAVEFVDKKLPDLREKVEVLQGQLQDLRLKNDMIDPVTQAGQLASQIGSFSHRQLELEAELKKSRSVYNDLVGQLVQAQEKAASSALAENPRYQTLLNTLLELDAQMAEASTIYLDTSPDMEVLQEQRQNLLGLLASEGQQSQRQIISQIQELESQNQAFKQTLQGLNSDVDNLSGVARSYDDIQQELLIARENLNQFIAKREALQIDAAQREIPWELVTPTGTPKPISTSLAKFLVFGGMVGTLLGIGIALLLEESSGVIYSEEDLKRSTRLPILGAIPAYNAAQDVAAKASAIDSVAYVGASIRGERNGSGHRTGADERSSTRPYARDPFSEAFRSLYTNLRLLNSEQPIRSVAVSSAMPGEGKSTVALHLAEAAAAMGQRVLLVDADLRNPQVHNYLELPNTKGLTNLFSGEANPAVIQKFSPEPNMYVISSGTVAFEPTRLFSSRSMKQFAEQVRTKFDLVIYDTPPLIGQADAYLIADNTDGLLLVTQPGKLKQPLLDRAMEQLRIADIRVLGIVTREG